MLTPAFQIAPAQGEALLKAAEAAARAIPPAFPLDATVAVNPFLGQSGEDLATTAARMARVAGLRITRARTEYAAEVAAGRITDDDLEAALATSSSAAKPADLQDLKARLAADSPPAAALPTVADLAAQATGTDWPALIARSFGLWAGGYFDRGQALWSPAPGKTAFAAWREWATHDLTAEIAGLKGFCAHVAAAPDTTERAILRTTQRLGIVEAAAETCFHRLLIDLGGWAQHARWLLWQAEQNNGTDTTLIDLLAIRLIWEEALLAHVPDIAAPWAQSLAGHAQPVTPAPDQIVDAILQEATERAHQRRLADALAGPKRSSHPPKLLAAFCIDVRSEVFRRNLESLDPGIRTLGFAGFFGLPVAHRPHGTDAAQAHLPVLLNPTLRACSHAAPEIEQAARISARAKRAWGRFRQAAVSSFAFVEAAGPIYGWKLVKDAFGLGGHDTRPEPAPRFEVVLTPEQKASTAAAILRAMSLTQDFAPVVLLIGHGAQTTNNPHESAYHCGACGGQTGAVSARLLAGLLNDHETRAGLVAHGIEVPAETCFVAGLHNTTTDSVTLYDLDAALPGATIAQAKAWLNAAATLSRTERAASLPGAKAADVARRARNWAEVRPEWGLAGCAAFVAAPRAATAGRNLDGRAFLHDYDWRADAGFATLELILTAPVVVASWISLQYYGSAVAPELFGGGNKLIHNAVGGIGVVQGNGGVLRAGLPWQAVHDGDQLAHEPLRLSVFVEAPHEAITEILMRHPQVRTLFDQGWLHLFTLEQGRVAQRYRPNLAWSSAVEVARAA
jgi:uncharacterized protein YbcC (UPF0753/DUF2309 family)